MRANEPKLRESSEARPPARDDRDSPHRALLRAVLEIAVRDLRSCGRTRDAASSWFEAEDDGAFTFRWICEVLGLNAEWFRRHAFAERLHTAVREVVAPLVPGWLSMAALRGVELRLDLAARLPLGAEEHVVVGEVLERLVPEAIHASPPCAGASVAVVVGASSKRLLHLSVRRASRTASGRRRSTGAEASRHPMLDDTMTMLRGIADAHAARWRCVYDGRGALVQVDIPRRTTMR